ncbi:hypothetical protein Tco_1424332 [Tanacetum coccineum]
MTKVTDVEANLEQFKIDQAAINSKTAEQLALLQETMEKNKVEADRQFAELMNAIKTQQPSTTTPPVTLPSPTRLMPTPIAIHLKGGSVSFGFSSLCHYQLCGKSTQIERKFAYTTFITIDLVGEMLVLGFVFEEQGFFGLEMGKPESFSQDTRCD